MKLVLGICLISVTVFAQGKTTKAHVHGKATLSIAMDGLKGEVELEAPADGIVGFESEPKTAAQKKQLEAALDVLRKRGAELVMFPAGAGCRLTPKEVDVHREGASHSEIHAHYDLQCAKPVTGEIRFGVTKLFPKTTEVQVQWISDQSQKSLRVVRDMGVLKP
jgi:hypothetical protein